MTTEATQRAALTFGPWWRAGLVILAFVAGTSGAAAPPFVREANTTLTLPQNPPTFGFQTVRAFENIPNIFQPVAIVTPPGERNRLFVVGKRGNVRVIPDLENPELVLFLSVPVQTGSSATSEQGLLGLAFHPDYQQNGRFFLFYTAQGVGAPNRLSQFQVDPANPNRGILESEIILINQSDEAGNHNGGDLHFGPDGYLYVSLGDEGGGNDRYRNSQRIDRDFFSGILRIDVDKREGNLEPNRHDGGAVGLDAVGKARYSVPRDNPFVGATEFNGAVVSPDRVRTEFWAVGLRNPWRMSFDSATGALYTGDVGQGGREEIDLIVKGGNYGWWYREGFVDGAGARQEPEGLTFIEPILDYPRGNGSKEGISVTGGVVYRGTRFSQLFGAYIFADWGSGNIWALRHDGTEVTQWENLARDPGIAAFGVDPRNGDILLADQGSSRLQVLTNVAESEGEPIPESLDLTGAFSDLATLTPNPGIVAYELNTPFWSDGARKTRWFSVPDPERMVGFSSDSHWQFPAGSIWIKHFELELKRGDPDSSRRIETRFLVRNDNGVYGITYRWDDSQENAFLVGEEGMDETFEIEEDGVLRNQVWRYPSRGECLACHAEEGGWALAFNTPQLNREMTYSTGSANQLVALSAAGYLDADIDDATPYGKLVEKDDRSTSVTARVRSYLTANCAHCHRPGGSAIGGWDAQFETPTVLAGLINGSLANPANHPTRRIVVPGDIDNSDLYRRIVSTGPDRMPPLATSEFDREAIDLLEEWISTTLSTDEFSGAIEEIFTDAKDTVSAAPDADPDGDGLHNSLELFLGSDPIVPEPVDFRKLAVARSGPNIRISFPKVSDRGLRVELQRSNDLDGDAEWDTVALPAPSPFIGEMGAVGSIEQPIAENDDLFYRILFIEP